MKRLYFIADDVQTLLQAKSTLNSIAQKDIDLHVWGRDREALIKNALPPLEPLAQSDIIHSGEQGALFGVIAGILVGGVLTVTNPFGIDTGFLPFLLVVVLFTFFGSWLGGLIGASSDNYQLEKFHSKVDAGKYVVQLDLAQNVSEQAVAQLKKGAPKLAYAGEADAWNNPLRGSFLKHTAHGHRNRR